MPWYRQLPFEKGQASSAPRLKMLNISNWRKKNQQISAHWKINTNLQNWMKIWHKFAFSFTLYIFWAVVPQVIIVIKLYDFTIIKLVTMQFQFELLISYMSSGMPFFLLVLNCGVVVSCLLWHYDRWICESQCWFPFKWKKLEKVQICRRIPELFCFLIRKILIMLHLTTEFFVFFLKNNNKISNNLKLASKSASLLIFSKIITSAQ